jgi:16S rRNA processing protein RimM
LEGDFAALGKITGAYGIRGWVKVETFAPAAQSLLNQTKRWWREPPGESFSVVSSRVHGAGPGAVLVGQLEHVATREEAAALRGCLVGVSRKAFPSLVEGEFYQRDLIGSAVINREGIVLGKVTAVDSHGASEFLVLDTVDVLIPFVPNYIDSVDLKAQEIRVDWSREWLDSKKQ